MKGVLPDHVLNQRKRGFPMPVAEWARGALKQDMTDILLDKNSIAADLVGREHLAHILTSHSHGADRSKALWQLYNLNKFCSIYGLNA
jgi:asparagine synthase (glutamine-hydrolysing)